MQHTAPIAAFSTVGMVAPAVIMFDTAAIPTLSPAIIGLMMIALAAIGVVALRGH